MVRDSSFHRSGNRTTLNKHGGNAKATNGYDYLFAEGPQGLVSLADLRREPTGEDATPAEEGEADAPQ